MSQSTSITPRSPLLTGVASLSKAYAIGAVPHPASFDITPRVIPKRIAGEQRYPKKPLISAFGVNASLNIFAVTIPMLSLNTMITAKQHKV